MSYTYYFKFNKEIQEKFNYPEFASIIAEKKHIHQPTIINFADRVWREGPRFGIKLIKDREHSLYGYIQAYPEEVKEFMWVKLSAVEMSWR